MPSSHLCLKTSFQAILELRDADLCAGLVLVNSAGKIVPDYTPEAGGKSGNGKTGPPALVADVVSWGIFNFLERSVAK